MATAEEVAFREMQATCVQMRIHAPTPQFDGDGSGPFFETSDRYRELKEHLRWLRNRFPRQFEQLGENDRMLLGYLATHPRVYFETHKDGDIRVPA